MDVPKLTTSDKVIAGSGIALFIAALLPWFKDATFGFYPSRNGWDVGPLWGGIPALLGAAAAGAVLLHKLGRTELPPLPISWGRAYLIAGGAAAGLVSLKLLLGERFYDRAWGLPIATIAALGLLVGGWLADQEERATPSP